MPRRVTVPRIERNQPPPKERSNDADRKTSDRSTTRERRTGEGAQSALLNLRNIERNRDRSKPADDSSDD